MNRWNRVLGIVLLTLLATAAGAAEEATDFDSVTDGLERRSGLFDLFVDRDSGRVWLVLPPATGCDASN